MSKIHFTVSANRDGSITIPAFATRGLGYGPGDSVALALPLDPCLCDECEDNELTITRGCEESDEPCYSGDSGRFSIPDRFLSDANIPQGADVTVMVADGTLLIVATVKELPVELCALLNELGISPINIHAVEEEVL